MERTRKALKEESSCPFSTMISTKKERMSSRKTLIHWFQGYPQSLEQNLTLTGGYHHCIGAEKGHISFGDPKKTHNRQTPWARKKQGLVKQQNIKLDTLATDISYVLSKLFKACTQKSYQILHFAYIKLMFV